MFLGPQLHPDAPIGKHLLGRSDPLRPLSQTQAPSAELPTHPAPHGGCQNPSLPHSCSHFSALCSPASAHGSSSRGSPRPPHAGGSAQLPRGDGASPGGCLPAAETRVLLLFQGAEGQTDRLPLPAPRGRTRSPRSAVGGWGGAGCDSGVSTPAAPRLWSGQGDGEGGPLTPSCNAEKGTPGPSRGFFPPLGSEAGGPPGSLGGGEGDLAT